MLNKKKKIFGFWTGSPFSSLVYGLIKTGGRNNKGRICSYKHMGGFKRKYRIIDFYRNLWNIEGVVLRLEYDPNRSSFIALICYKNGFITYILAVENLQVNDFIVNYSAVDLLGPNRNFFLKISYKKNYASSFLLKDIPTGTLVSHIELKPGLGACFCRAAGTFAIVLNKYNILNKYYVLVRLPSGVEYLLLENCRAVLGIVSNMNKREFALIKAGTARNKGKKPTVRGVAMNPVDHPHGGGEGKKSPKRCAMSPWGKLSKGIKTKKKNNNNKFILKKRK